MQSRIILKAVNRSFLTRNSSSWDYDVAVCGGGVVGASLVAKLQSESRGTLKVCIIDNFVPVGLQTCLDSDIPDIRVYALAPKSISMLQKLGAWDRMSNRSQAYDEMQVWESKGAGFLRFSASEMGAQELGRIAEDRTIQNALYKTIESFGSQQGLPVDFFFGTNVVSLSIGEAGNKHSGPAKLSFVSVSKSPSAPAEEKTITAR